MYFESQYFFIFPGIVHALICILVNTCFILLMQFFDVSVTMLLNAVICYISHVHPPPPLCCHLFVVWGDCVPQ